MKTARLTLVLSLLAPSCAEPAPTFGDAAEELSIAFCERLAECTGRPPQSLPYCVDHNIQSLCQIWDCSEDIPAPEQALVDQCSEDLSARDCDGQLSEACVEVLDL